MVGLEHRAFEYTFDPGPALGPVNGFNVQSAEGGKNDFKDVFGEVLLPLASNQPLAQSLELTLGYRYVSTVYDQEGFYDLNQQRSQLALDQFPEADVRISTVKGKLNGLPTSYAARLFVWNKASFARAGLPLPRTWEDLFAAGPAFKARLGERAYPLDGEIYDMLLLSQAYIHQKYGTPYVHSTEPRVAMSKEALLEWVRTYKRLVETHVATPTA